MKKMFATVSLLSMMAYGSVYANADTEAAGRSLGAAKVAEVKFDQGSTQLSESEKSEIRKAIQDASAAGKVKEVRVVTWADREYPTQGASASPQDISLAQSRADQVKSFLKTDLKVSKVETFNMAKRPNQIQQWLGTKTAATKDGLESSGAAPKTDSETGMLNQNAQASKAVLMIFR